MEANKRQNFISANRLTVRSSYGEYFTIGETVTHEDPTAGTARIIDFAPDEESNEVRAYTDKGWTHIDFLNKVPSKNEIINKI